MQFRYRCKNYLNASHYIIIDKKKGDIHSHCFEICIEIQPVDQMQFLSFLNIEKIIDDYLEQYQNKLLNDVFPFTSQIPTLENIVSVFKNSLIRKFKEINCEVIKIEVSETPARSCMINIKEESELNFVNLDDNDFFIDLDKFL